jgi:selenocysteine lyase/cysteine desulfurase
MTFLEIMKKIYYSPLLDYLSAKNSVRLLGPSDASKKAPTVAVALKESPEAVAGELSKHGIMAGGGDFYAVRCIKAQGIDPHSWCITPKFCSLYK